MHSEAEKTLEVLRQFNYSDDEIRKTPAIFVQTGIAIANRQKIFEECCFKRINVGILAKYVTIMNKPIKLLKSHRFIDDNVNLVSTLLKHIDIEVIWDQDLSENMTLSRLRQCLLNLYFVRKFNVSDETYDKIWKSYPRIRHKSFYSILEAVEFAERELNFSKEKIIKNG